MTLKGTFAWSLLAAGIAVTGWSQQAPPPLPPLPQASPAPEATAEEDSADRPSLPTTPLDVSQLSEEDQEQLRAFLAGQLPADASFDELLRFLLDPQPYPKDTVVRFDDGYAAPHKAVPWKMEVVKEDETNVWLRHLPPENPRSILHKLWLDREQREMLVAIRARMTEVQKPFFLDFSAPVVPPPYVDSLGFESVASGLPAKGRWQMNFAVADMNGDKVLDLVFPPERLGYAFPVIFLGEGGGRFSHWKEARWTSQVPYDYGGLETADFDGDGDQDIVLAIHFKGQYVLYNDGGGQFARATMLPSPDPRVTARTSAVADYDGDGRLDVAFLAEISYDQAKSSYLPKAITSWVALNRAGNRWELLTAGMPAQVIGDNLAAADVDGDRRPDLLLSSGTTNWRSLVWRNAADGWEESYGLGVLSNGWHFQVIADPKPPAGTTQLYAAFQQFMMVGGQNQVRTGLVRYRWGADGLAELGETLVVDDKAVNQYSRVAAGDLNGDGRTDLVAGRKGGGLEVFLQNPDGTFSQERAPELEGHGRPYCMRLIDLDGDGRDDLVASFAPRDKLEGGIKVWLSRAGT